MTRNPQPTEDPVLDLSEIRVAGEAVADAPLNALDRLTLVGQPGDVGGVLRAIGRLPGTAFVEWPADPGRLTVDRLAASAARTRVRSAQGTGGGAPVDLDRACAHFGFALARERRTRLRDLDPEARARLRCALTLAAPGQWMVLEDPLGGIAEQARAGIRGRLLDACIAFRRGLVASGSSVIDAAVLGDSAVAIEKGRIADSGPLEAQLAEPRSSLAAAATGVTVFSGLARRGWLSIGHSQVRARTDLDGKVYVTIPTAAARLSFDEFDPGFTSDSVFEAIVVGIRDSGRILQVVLSPADTEVGLALTADLLDFSPAARHPARAVTDTADREEPPAPGTDGMDADPAPHRPWGVLHPGLGTSVAATVSRVTVGTRLFVDVDTSRMHAYPVDARAGSADD